MQQLPAQFEDRAISHVYDEERKTWWFSVIDIIQVLTGQADYQTARKYWNKLKERLGKEGSESVTECHRLKLRAADGKNYLTDVATAETLLHLVQSVPSPRAEPIKLWLAKVGYERLQELADPARALDRARETWQKHGRSEKWIAQRTTMGAWTAGIARAAGRAARSTIRRFLAHSAAMGRRIVGKLSCRSPLFSSNISVAQAPGKPALLTPTSNSVRGSPWWVDWSVVGLRHNCLVPCDSVSHRVWRLGAARDAMKQLYQSLGATP